MSEPQLDLLGPGHPCYLRFMAVTGGGDDNE